MQFGFLPVKVSHHYSGANGLACNTVNQSFKMLLSMKLRMKVRGALGGTIEYASGDPQPMDTSSDNLNPRSVINCRRDGVRQSTTRPFWQSSNPCEITCFIGSIKAAMLARHDVDKIRLVATKSTDELLIPNSTKMSLSHSPKIPWNRRNYVSSMGEAVGIESSNSPFSTFGRPWMTSFTNSDKLQKPHRTKPPWERVLPMFFTQGTKAM